MNVARLLHACARAQPGDLAIRRGEARADYLAVSMDAERIAAIVAESFDVDPDQRVALILPGIPELASVFFGILWAGAVAVLLDPAPAPDGGLDITALGDALGSSHARLLVAWHADAELAEAGAAAQQTQCLFVEPREFSRLVSHTNPRPLADRRPTDPAVIGLASCGAPWSYTHGELIEASRNLARAERLELRGSFLRPAGSSDRDLILSICAAVSVGASLVIVEDDHALTASHPAATHGVCK